MFPIRLATPDDLEAILGLIDGAAGWLRTMNTDQWAKPWPDLAERDARVLRGLLACRTWLVEDDGIPVATVTYRPDGNHDLWTPEERAELSVYMSRLVINRDYGGQGIGAALTDWAGARARDEYGAQTLRIDVWTTNHALHAYYKGCGFHFLRKYEEEDDPSGKTTKYPSAALFSKPTKEIEVAPGALFWEVPAIAATPAQSALRATAVNADEISAGRASGGLITQAKLTASRSAHRSHMAMTKCMSAAWNHARLRCLKRHATISTCAHLVTLIAAQLFSTGDLNA